MSSAILSYGIGPGSSLSSAYRHVPGIIELGPIWIPIKLLILDSFKSVSIKLFGPATPRGTVILGEEHDSCEVPTLIEKVIRVCGMEH
jgi:hypothetical protein